MTFSVFAVQIKMLMTSLPVKKYLFYDKISLFCII